MGHVIEYVALELQGRVGHEVTRGRTRGVKNRPGTYHVMYAFRAREVALLAGRLAIELVETLLPAEFGGTSGLHEFGTEAPASLSEGFEMLQNFARHSTQPPAPWWPRRSGGASRSSGSTATASSAWAKASSRRRIRASCTDRTSQVATDIAGDKELTKRLLDEAGLPVPRGAMLGSAEAAVDSARRLGFPVVVKPLDGNLGRDVNTGLASDHDVRWAYDQAAPEGAGVIVEQQMPSDDHRLLVVGGRLVAAARRLPPTVMGDGVQSIRELVEDLFRDPRRGEGHEAIMTLVEIDECIAHFLGSQGLSPNTVPRGSGDAAAAHGQPVHGRLGHRRDRHHASLHPAERRTGGADRRA